MSGAVPKNLKDYLPILADQGIPNVVGSKKRGVSLQVIAGVAMPADGVFVFADYGLADMKVDSVGYGGYAVIVQNHTDVADEAACLPAARLSNKLTLSGPDTADVLDIVIIGQMVDQLGE